MKITGGAVIDWPIDTRTPPWATRWGRVKNWLAERWGFVWPTQAELELRNFELSLSRLITNTISGEDLRWKYEGDCLIFYFTKVREGRFEQLSDAVLERNPLLEALKKAGPTQSTKPSE